MANGTVLLALREDPLGGGVSAEQLRRIGKELENRGLELRRAADARDARAMLQTEAGLAAAVVAWDLPRLPSGTPAGEAALPTGGAEVLDRIRHRFKDLPVFLLMTDSSDHDLEHLPLWVSETVVGYIWPLEDTPAFIAGRVAAAARTYLKEVLPPFFRALRRFDDAHEYSWHTPAHSGGVAFLKSPAGRAFFDYYGERLFRTDLSISVGELGSLYEHSGPIGEAERNAARVFGAERTYFVLHGDSTCNRMVGHYSVTADEIALVDRNCHKSVLHGLVVSGARPVYLVPTRNGYGLAGPVPPPPPHRQPSPPGSPPTRSPPAPSHRTRSTRSSPTPPTTASATTPSPPPAPSPRARPACTSTRPGSPTPASTPSTGGGTAWPSAPTPSKRPSGRPCSPPTPPTSCSPRSRSAPWSTYGPHPAHPWNTTASTKRS